MEVLMRPPEVFVRELSLEEGNRLKRLSRRLLRKGRRCRSRGGVAGAIGLAVRRAVPVSASGQVVARWCLWSLRRLWVAVSIRRSVLTAERPRWWKAWAPRLCLIWPKTGSIMPWRFR